MSKEIEGYTKFESVESDGIRTEMVIPGNGYRWVDLLNSFVMFLRGNGFSIPDGSWEELHIDTVGEVLSRSNYDMPHRTDKPFEGCLYECIDCGDGIQSQYPGHYSNCSCGNSAVDQTHEYTRVIGMVQPYQEDAE